MAVELDDSKDKVDEEHGEGNEEVDEVTINCCPICQLLFYNQTV